MSFGTSVGDCIVLAQLAFNTYQGAKKACGEHDELTRQVSSLCKVLNRLQKELSNPESLVNKASYEKRQELEEHAAGCEGILKTMNHVLMKYNALSGEQRRGKKLWQKIKFGNGQTKDLADIRIKLSAHTSAIVMSLNLCSLDSLGRVEATLGIVEARSTSHGEQLRGTRKALHWVTANMAAATGEGSVWTSYTNDDQMFWRELRRELVKEGYRSSTLQRHKRLIKNYVEELGNRGVFDDALDLEGSAELNYGPDADSIVLERWSPLLESSDTVSNQVSSDGDDVARSGPSIVAEDGKVSTAVSEQPTDFSTPVARPSKNHDGSSQHNRVSCASHNHCDTAGQDENDYPDTPLTTTLSISEAMEISDLLEAPKATLALEAFEETKSEVISDGHYPQLSVLDPLTTNKPNEEVHLSETLHLTDTTDLDNQPDSPSFEISEGVEDAEDVEDVSLLGVLPNLDIAKETGRMSERATNIRDLHLDTCWHIIPGDMSTGRAHVPEDEFSESEQSMLTDGPSIECHHGEQGSAVVQPNPRTRSSFAVQIEDVLDEAFASSNSLEKFEELIVTMPCQETLRLVAPGDEFLSTGTGEGMGTDQELSAGAATGDIPSKPPPAVSLEEVLDEDFFVDAHPNVSTTNLTFDYDSDAGATLAQGSTHQKKAVRFAKTKLRSEKAECPLKKFAPEDLRFIFYGETRDFSSYRELQESYQAIFDEAQGGEDTVYFSKPENTTTFITNSPYTPPATIYDLQYYKVPASYFHTFWHPQRVPIYLHGNVFDGISLTNWMYNWTGYAFQDNSYRMDAVRRFGKTVIKLGSALSDIEHADPLVKANLPKDLYDESGVLWADLENVINDIMAEAEDGLEASKIGGRLEVEFVSRFCNELIAGKKYYRLIEKFLRETEAWCKKARFHPDFIILWELWES